MNSRGGPKPLTLNSHSTHTQFTLNAHSTHTQFTLNSHSTLRASPAIWSPWLYRLHQLSIHTAVRNKDQFRYVERTSSLLLGLAFFARLMMEILYSRQYDAERSFYDMYMVVL